MIILSVLLSTFSCAVCAWYLCQLQWGILWWISLVKYLQVCLCCRQRQGNSVNERGAELHVAKFQDALWRDWVVKSVEAGWDRMAELCWWSAWYDRHVSRNGNKFHLSNDFVCLLINGRIPLIIALWVRGLSQPRSYCWNGMWARWWACRGNPQSDSLSFAVCFQFFFSFQF